MQKTRKNNCGSEDAIGKPRGGDHGVAWFFKCSATVSFAIGRIRREGLAPGKITWWKPRTSTRVIGEPMRGPSVRSG